MDSSLSSCDNTGFQKHGNFQNYYYIALNKDTKWMCHAVKEITLTIRKSIFHVATQDL